MIARKNRKYIVNEYINPHGEKKEDNQGAFFFFCTQPET